MMNRPLRAPPIAHLVILMFVSAAVVAARPPQTEPATSAPTNDAELTDFYRLVKQFDFNERPLGNYEDAPMHWIRLTGPGMPNYARGEFDDEIGHNAPPSFRLSLIGGNVAYEYRQPDLAVIPGSDYRVETWVRTEGLEHARAFIEAHSVNRYGDVIAGSARISRLVGPTATGADDWQRVQVDLPGDFATAYGLRLRLWILQSYVWRERNEFDVDPIIRRDIYARAWFDDIAVYRLPRARLRLSNAGGIVAPGAQESFLLEFASATAHGLEADFVITDSAGRVCHTERANVPSALTRSESAPRRSGPEDFRTAATVRVRVPPLTPGFYRATLRVLSGQRTLMTREIRFAVLPKLPTENRPHPDLGVDLGPWRGGVAAAAANLVATLGCGSAKIGVPMVGELSSEEKNRYFRQISELVRRLGRAGIETTGVILSQSAAADPATGLSTQRLIRAEVGWRRLFSPVQAHFSGLLPAWQLGYERTELRNQATWQADAVEQVRQHLSRFMTLPRLIIPYEVTALPPADGDTQSLWVPATIPARTLPWQLQFLVEPHTATRWVTLEADRRPELGREARLSDLARRIVLTKALGPERVFVHAPLEQVTSGGEPGWQPTEAYIVLRTLFHALSGRNPIGTLDVGPDNVAIIFGDPLSSCLVLWTWRDAPVSRELDLDLGRDLKAIDLWGRAQPLEITDRGTRLQLSPLPTIVHGVDAALTLLQSSFHLDPKYVQIHDTKSRPTLRFRNHYERPISGTLTLQPPKDWDVVPRFVHFDLGPGQMFAQELDLTIPPRQVASKHNLAVRLALNQPNSVDLNFATPLVVGLHDVVLDAEASWAGDDLIVEQSLRNISDRPVSFSAFCQAPARARAEQEFLNVAPGQITVRTYAFRDARELAGLTLHLGIQEIRGRRTLDQLVQVPR